MSDWHAGIRPVHSSLQTLSASSAHIVAVSDYNETGRAYQSLITLTASSAHTSFQTSGYQYTQSSYLVSFDEKLSLADAVSTLPVVFPENLGIRDFLKNTVYLSFTEKLSLSDFASGTALIEEEIVKDWGSMISVSTLEDDRHGTTIQISEDVFNRWGSQIVLPPYTLVAVTNATSASNPFLPTLIIGGSVIYSNPATTPAAYNDTGVYIQFANAGVTGVDLCQLYNFGFTLDYNGGSWNATTSAPMNGIDQAALGNPVTFFGLRGTITDAGQIKSNAVAGYKQSGIFGTPILNKEYIFAMSGHPMLSLLMTDQTLRINNSDFWTTVASAAYAVAATCSVHLIWAAQDAPYHSTISEAGGTALEALSSLSQRVGASLRWSGNDEYTVAYPDRCYGLWEVPRCSLIAAGGLEYDWHLDLASGLSGLGVILIPQYKLNTFDAGTRELGVNQEDEDGNQPPQGSGILVQQLAKVTKRMSADDPPLVYDLPQDWDAPLYIQILVAPGQEGGGNFVTSDPQEWFKILDSQYTFNSDVGGRLIPQCKVDSTLFPIEGANSAVDSGNFVLSLAAHRKSLESAYNQSVAERAAEQKDLLARQQDQYRFIKTYSGTINCLFYGALPLPGMCGKATVDGFTVEGVIESVTFTFPGVLTVNVAQYIRVGFIDNLGNISATG